MKLTKEDKKIIFQAVQRNEAFTSAEIAWCITGRSSSYTDAALIWGIVLVAFGIVLQLVMELSGSWDGDATLSLVESVVLFAVGLLVAKIPSCRRLVIDKNRMRRQVIERAQASFYRGGVQLTKGHNGVLVFVSVFERLIIIIADKAIDDVGVLKEFIKVVNSENPDKKSWGNKNTVIQKCINHIDALGVICGSKLPRQVGDVNELSDDGLNEKEV
ncbi:MAG: hypothetical protein WC621_00440 [Patescibacteria group bacterium]